MRRYFLLITATSLLLACQHEADEAAVDYVPSETAICFDATTDGAETRAVGEINDNATLRARSFGVFACYTGHQKYEFTTVWPDFMYNQQVSYASSRWDYSPVKYWPNSEDDYVSFFAYAPYEGSPSESKCIAEFSRKDDPGDPWLVYKLAEDPWSGTNGQVDLLYGINDGPTTATTDDQPWYNQQKNSYSTTERLRFTFRHALACVGDEITVKLASDLSSLISGYGRVYITKLTLDFRRLTGKARLVLNSRGTPKWEAVVSGDVIVNRTLSLNFTSTEITSTATTVSTGKGLLYIPLQVAGVESPTCELTLDYQIVNNASEIYNGTATGSLALDLLLNGKKQAIAITLSKDLTLGAQVYTLGTGASEPSYARKR